MARVTLPDKICPHCGGTEWYHMRKRLTYIFKCVPCERKRQQAWQASPSYDIEKARARNKRYRESHKKGNALYKLQWEFNHPEKAKASKKRSKKRQIERLTNNYIRNMLVAAYARLGIQLTAPQIPIEEVEKHRIHLIKVRTLKKVRQMEKESSIRPERLIVPIGVNAASGSVTTKDMNHQEKQSIYNARHAAKKALLKANPPKTTKQEKLDEKWKAKLTKIAEREIEKESYAFTSVEEYVETAVYTNAVEPEEDVVTEFRKLELRRNEIIEQVKTFNNYVESFKINLS